MSRESIVVYQATVETNNKRPETYVGITEGPFKTRYNNHKHTFNNMKLKQSTVLSKYVWNLKNNSQKYKISWKIIGKAESYSNKTNKCNLCLLEKYTIMTHKTQATLNTRSELIGCCRHSKKFLLHSGSENH